MKYLFIFLVFVQISQGFSQGATIVNYIQVCEQRIQTAQANTPNDTMALRNLCGNPMEIGKAQYLLCDSCCLYVEKKVLDPNPKNKIVLYSIFWETGFKIADFTVNIQHHDQCKVKTFRDPTLRSIALPRGGPILINMYEYLRKIRCI